MKNYGKDNKFGRTTVKRVLNMTMYPLYNKDFMNDQREIFRNGDGKGEI